MARILSRNRFILHNRKVKTDLCWNTSC